MPHKNTYQGHSFLSIWVKQDFSDSGALEKLGVGMLATEKNAAAMCCKHPANSFEGDYSESEGAMEARAGSLGQNLARGC